MDLSEEYNKQPEKPIIISYINYKHANVFLMARIMDLDYEPQSRLEFTYEYYEDFGLGGGAIFGIVFLVMLLCIFVVALLLLFLNKYGVINLYMPRKLRVFFINRFITPEQKQAYLAEEATEG